jgi:uncharacterized membrane protein HdeD (DUF308 family)
MSKNLRNVWLGISIFVLLVGLALIIWPTGSQNVLCYIVGAVLMLAGIVQAFLHWKDGKNSNAISAYISAVLLFLIGLLLLLRKDAFLQMWSLIMGALLIIDSLYKLNIALHLKKAALKSWKRSLIVTAVLLVCGVLMIFAPSQSTKAITVLIGIALVLDAGANIWAYIDSNKINLV